MGLCGGEGSEEREREWEEAAEAVAYDSCTWPPPVVAVCGPGNSGKSAFSRLLLNTLIGRYKRVAYLDTDVGQPEFTPPGFVSLHVLEEQTKDLTMIYLRPPKRCFFFGDVGAHRNPKLLLSYIFGLYDYFLQELYCSNETDNPKKSAIPLVINTSGWVKGIGLHVLSEILRYVSPTDVIRLHSTSEGKNLPDGAFWLDGHQGDSRVNLIVIRASQNSPRHLLVKKEARMIRDLRLIAYFRQCLPRDFPVFSCDDLVHGFSAIDPFQLPISKIQVIDLHCQVSGGAVYDFLTGTIVGLGSSTCLPLSTECSSPWCIGLGFIKAVDIPGNCIHLITPASHHLLENIDIIFRSCITVPTCLLQVSDEVDDITERLRDL
ncbi:polynucleotide 5'-hydroxyl-kinase NOL9-like [Lolium rigidum]|uniref:polynucleotide 5'-hydroxyl-kinase NOL9-like n=1 Tax=Lolium rigidum TaxID=89674 RepID=UPI001F5E1B81|nr:polynucleotide 5'-hydroxyl-kinase NOL9-like [Lolium rigidum]